MRSPGMRFFIVALLTLLMFIPLMMVSDIVNERRHYSNDTIRAVGLEWGGPQRLTGPQLVLPVSEHVAYTRKREVVDPATGRIKVHEASGEPIFETYVETVREARAPVYLFPGRYDVTVDTETELRHRGIFNVPVYRASVAMIFDFPYDAVAGLLNDGEEVDWTKAELRLFITRNRALRGEAELTIGGTPVPLEPMTDIAGIVAHPGDLRGSGAMTLRLGLNGAQSLMITPVGRTTKVAIASDWSDPSFAGTFLPDRSDITKIGFSAVWTIPHLARALPQIAREDTAQRAHAEDGFGVRFIETNDFYQKAWRAARYGILFIALTFLSVLLIDGGRERPVHPVQYILIGLAQSIFVLLMLSYAEQIGFGAAYLLSAGATIALLVLYGVLGLKLGRRIWVLAAMLILLYAVLYLILRSTDFALIAGASLSFLALAATMFATRNEEWYGPDGPGKGMFNLKRTRPAPAPEPARPDQQ